MYEALRYLKLVLRDALLSAIKKKTLILKKAAGREPERRGSRLRGLLKKRRKKVCKKINLEESSRQGAGEKRF